MVINIAYLLQQGRHLILQFRLVAHQHPYCRHGEYDDEAIVICTCYYFK